MTAAPARRPSALLPLAHLLTAALAFIAAAVALPWLAFDLAGHYYHPRILALTHTVTLGWITLTIMGASYQIIPVVLGRPLWSERLAWWQYGAFVTGVIGLAAHLSIARGPGLLWSSGNPDEGLIDFWVLVTHGAQLGEDRRLRVLAITAYRAQRDEGSWQGTDVEELCEVVEKVPRLTVYTTDPKLADALAESCPFDVEVRSASDR